jgi:hypothetical protein
MFAGSISVVCPYYHRTIVLIRQKLLRFVLIELFDDSLDLLVHWHDTDEGSSNKGPASTEGGPNIEASLVEYINGQHRARPDAHEEESEGDCSDVGGQFGCTELLDNQIQSGTIVEILTVGISK